MTDFEKQQKIINSSPFKKLKSTASKLVIGGGRNRIMSQDSPKSDEYEVPESATLPTLDKDDDFSRVR